MIFSRALLHEARRRGKGPADYNKCNGWRARLTEAELDLGWDDTVDTARATLTELAAATDVAPPEICAGAACALEAISDMTTRHSWEWAQRWIMLVEREFHYDPLNHIGLLAGPVTRAAETPEVRLWMDDPALPPNVRQHWYYNVGDAWKRLGNAPAALPWFESMIEFSERSTPGDDIFLYIAEAHRFEIWGDMAFHEPDPVEKRKLYALIRDYARDRLETLPGPDHLVNNLAKWGHMAAGQLADHEGMEFFGPLARMEPKTRLWGAER